MKAIREAGDRTGEMGMITDETFSNHLHCRRKAFLKATGTPGELHDIERVRIDLDGEYFRRALSVYLARFGERKIVRSPPSLEAATGSCPRIIVDATAMAGNVQSRIQLLERAEHGGGTGIPSYVPVMFVRNDKITVVPFLSARRVEKGRQSLGDLADPIDRSTDRSPPTPDSGPGSSASTECRPTSRRMPAW